MPPGHRRSGSRWRQAAVAGLALIFVGSGLSSAPSRPAPPLQRPVVAVSGRDVSFDDQWKFFKGDNTRAKDTAFDDAAWRTLDLPHDWSAEGEFDSTLA